MKLLNRRWKRQKIEIQSNMTIHRGFFANSNTFLIAGMLGILSATSSAINPKGDIMLPKPLRNRQRFIEEPDEKKITPLSHSDEILRYANQSVNTHIYDTITYTQSMNRTNLDFTLTAAARKNREYSKNTLNETTRTDFRNDSSIINANISNNSTVAPFSDPYFDQPQHNDAQYWLIFVFKALLFLVLFILYFKGIKNCCILPALRRLGWINDSEPERIDTSVIRFKPVDIGPLCKKAGLAGMLMEERKLVVNEVFKNSHFCYDLSIPLSEQRAQIIEQNTEHEDCVNTSEKRVGENANELLHSLSSTNDDDENQCSICLSTLKESNIVMRANKCEHVFHVDCSMGWFHKKDYCPYCRCEIMTPSEMLQAAIVVLGKDRVKELRRCNEMLTTSPDPQEQEPQHDELDIHNEAETDSNSPALVQSRE